MTRLVWAMVVGLVLLGLGLAYGPFFASGDRAPLTSPLASPLTSPPASPAAVAPRTVVLNELPEAEPNSTTRASTAAKPGSELPPGVTVSAAASESKTVVEPPSVTLAPEQPSRNPVGLLLTLHPIAGGSDAIATFHAETREDDRRARLIAIQEALAQYIDGDPKDPIEFEAYEALKTEAAWLAEHRTPGF